MSKDEVIVRLECLKCLIEWEQPMEFVVALEEAIAALKGD